MNTSWQVSMAHEPMYSYHNNSNHAADYAIDVANVANTNKAWHTWKRDCHIGGMKREMYQQRVPDMSTYPTLRTEVDILFSRVNEVISYGNLG